MKRHLRWAIAIVSLLVVARFVYAATFERYVNSSGTQIYLLDDSGNLTIPGTFSAANQTITGVSSVQTDTVTGFRIYTPTGQFQIGVSTAIVPSSSYMILGTTGPASAIVSAATPSISTATAIGGSTAFTDGSVLVLTSTGTATSILLTDNGTLAGSMLHLAATTRSIAVNKYLTLIYRASTTSWNELSYAGNAN